MFKLYFSACFLQVGLAASYPYAQIIMRNTGFSQSEIGVILALCQLASCIIPLLICNVADKRNKTKQYLVLTAVLAVLCHSLVFVSSSKYLIYIAFISAYAFYGCISPLNDGIINIEIKKIGGTYSNFRSAGTLSYVVTLVLIAIIGFPNTSKNNQILTSILITGSIMVLSFACMDKPEVEKQTRSEKFFDYNWFDKGFYLLILILFIEKIATAVEEKFLGSYITEVLNLADKYTLFVALGALSEFTFMLIGGKLLKKGIFNEWGMILLSCCGLILRLTLYSASKNIIVFCLAQICHSLTFGSAHIATISYISKTVPKNHMALATTIYSSVATSLAIFVGSLFGGFIIDNLGYTSLFRIYTIFPVIALSLCFVLKKQVNNPMQYITNMKNT